MWILANCIFQEFGPFHLGYQVIGYQVVLVFSYYPFVVHGSVVMSSWSFLMLIIFVLSVFLSLVKGLSILLIFLRWQYLVSLFSSIVFLFLINFCSNFYYFFLLFTLDIISSSFSLFLRWNLKWLTVDFSYTLSIQSLNYPQALLSVHPQISVSCVSIFAWFKIYLNLFWDFFFKTCVI